MTARRTTRDLGPLDPCYPITRALSPREVHARSPRDERLTVCGRTIGHDLQPAIGTYVACRDCRVTTALIRDRETRGLPELCLVWSGSHKWRDRHRCMQPVEGHRLRPDLSYDHPWHDGVDLPPDWDDDVTEESG